MSETKVPRIRFKGFADDWEQRKVSEITKFHKQGFYTTEDYNESKKYYLLRGTDLTENKLILKDTPKIDATEKDYQAFKTEVGDFLIVRSGTVGTYGIVYEDIPAIFGSYLIDFRFDMEQVTNEFFGYFYQSESFKTQLRQIVQQSANTNINAENIKSTSIMLPSIDEQKRIGEYLGQIDNLITLHQRKYEKLQIIKKSMLENCFPKNGEKVPKIRFSGFTGDWEQRKWCDTVDISTEMVDPTSGEYDDMPHIAPGNIESFTGRILDNVKSVKEEQLISGKYRFRPGDVVYGKINPQLGKYFYASVDGLTSADAYVFNGKNGVTQKFLFSLLQTEDFFKYSVSVSKRSGMP